MRQVRLPHRPPKANVAPNRCYSVILSACAIEAYANDAIRRLPDDTVIEVPERVGGETVPLMRGKAGMDRLPIAEKLTRAVPVLTGRESIKGTTAWQAFRRVNRLRNSLVHVKAEPQSDPDEPGPFGKLILGEESTSPEDAASVIEALEPGWLPTHVRPRGVSGNPGRPQSLAKATRALVGEDGRKLAQFWFSIMQDDTRRDSDRLEASKLLADRGWGKVAVWEPQEGDPLDLALMEPAAEEFRAEVIRLAGAEERSARRPVQA